MGMDIDNRCLDEKMLSSYLDERLTEAERKRIEGHIADCNICLDMLLVAYESQGRNKKCPPILKDRIKNRFNLRQAKKRPELKWFFASMFFFALSFVFKGYFLQLLAIAVVLGFKWVMEGEGVKRAVMIFRGIQEKEKKFARKSPPDVSNIAGGDRYGKPE